MIPQSLIEACKDRRIASPHVAVLLFLHSVLNHVEPRPVKHWWLADQMHMKRQSVSCILTRLVECGYLREGPRQTRNVITYILLPTWGTGVTAETPQSERDRAA